MRTIKCWHCGQIVQANKEVALCPNCRAELKAASTLRQRTCRSCGAEFAGGPRAWHCPNCREERAKAATRAYKARAKSGKVRKIGSTDICQVCGKEYTVESGNQRYCPDCAPEAVRQIDHAQSRAWMAEHREAAAELKKERARNRKVCAVCGNIFYSSTPAVTCSGKCAKIMRSYHQAMADHKRRGSPAPTIDSVEDRLSQKSGVPGVSRSRNGLRWIARADNKHLGTYDSIDAAAQAIKDYNKHKQS